MLLEHLRGVGEVDILYVTFSTTSLRPSRSLPARAVSHAGAGGLDKRERGDDVGGGSERGRGARRSSDRDRGGGGG